MARRKIERRPGRIGAFEVSDAGQIEQDDVLHMAFISWSQIIRQRHLARRKIRCQEMQQKNSTYPCMRTAGMHAFHGQNSSHIFLM